MVRLTDCPDMTLDVYHGRKTTTQQQPYVCSYNMGVGVSLQNNPKNPDPSYKVDLDSWDYFGRGKPTL